MHHKGTLILLIIMGSLFIAPVQSANVTITIHSGTIESRMALSFNQNMTQLPSQSNTIDGATDASLMTNFNKSLRDTQPSKLSNVRIQVASNNNWLNATVSLTISGATSQQGDIMNASTTWKAFHVDADLRVDNLSYNTVGSRYLRSVYDYYVNASRFIGRRNSIITGVTFFDNQTSIGGNQAANQAGNLTLFDFRPLNASLDRWQYRYNLENDTTTWNYSPPATNLYSIRVTVGLNRTFTIFSNYVYDAEIIASGLARSKGNNVLADVGSGQMELTMTAVVIATIAAAIWAQILYRRRRKKAILKR